MKQVNDPGNSSAAANGQFLLQDRIATSHFVVGGHRAVSSNILEDVASTRNVRKRGNRNIRFRYAPDAPLRIHVPVPFTGDDQKAGQKNLTLLMPSPIALTLWRILDVLLFFGLPICVVVVPPKIPYQGLIFLLLWARTLFRFYNRVARSHFPATDVAISILGVPMFIYLLLRSYIHHRIQKSVSWKGRTYRPTN